MKLDLTPDEVDLVVEALDALAERWENDGDPCFDALIEKTNAVYRKIVEQSRNGESE